MMYNNNNPIEALIRLFVNFKNVRGKASAAEYWWNILLWLPVFIIIGCLPFHLILIRLPIIILIFIFFYGLCTCQKRRLNECGAKGKSKQSNILMYVPIVGTFIFSQYIIKK